MYNSLILRNGDLATRFDSVWDQLDRDFAKVFNWNGKTVKDHGYPRVDVSETDDHVLIEATVPGLTDEEVEVSYSNGVLAISGESEKRSEDSKYHIKELKRSRFTRSFTVPENAFDTDGITAHVDNGLLSVKVPKHKEVPKRHSVQKIKVNKGSPK